MPNLHHIQDLAAPLADGFAAPTRAFVQIIQGCDNTCSFCAIPSREGACCSKPVEDIVREVQSHIQSNHGEVVLVGPNIASFGTDLAIHSGLAHLIEAVLKAAPDLQRLRLGPLDPALLDQDFFDILAREARLMPLLHLSLQSADDTILKSMHRNHSVADLDARITEARNARPDVVFGADVIAGFPGETDAMFERTLQHLKRWNIVDLDVYPYRPLPGTAAADLKNNVADDVIKDRTKRLHHLADVALQRHLDSLTGRVAAVLTETETFGRTQCFVPVALAKPVGIGQVVDVAVTTQRDGQLLGAARGDYTTTSGDSSGGWLKKMKVGLGKSSERMTTGIGQVFTVRRRLDAETLEELEDVLITADLGVSTAEKLTRSLAKSRFDKEIGDAEVREAFALEIEHILQPIAKPLTINATLKPHVVLVCGVNGSGKTTTIGKLAKQFRMKVNL